MCDQLNVVSSPGVIVRFDPSESQGWVKVDNTEKSFSEHCFYGTSSHNTPTPGIEVTVTSSRSTDKVLIVFADN